MPSAFIINANAGATRRNPALPERLRRAAEPRAHMVVTQSDAELSAAALKLAAEGVDRVGVVGGDGTASATLTALWRAYGPDNLPKIAFLRGGTMNTVANSIGVSARAPLRLLERALRAWDNGAARYTQHYTIQVGDRLGFLFGTGIMYGYLTEYYAQGAGDPTPVTAARVLGRSVLSALVRGATYRRIRGHSDLAVRFEGGEWESRNYITVGAGTVAQAGLGFRPFYLAEQRFGSFHLLAIKGSATNLAADLPSIWLARGMRSRTAYETATTWAELRSSEPSFGYFVDGDLLVASSTLRLQLGPLFSVLCI